MNLSKKLTIASILFFQIPCAMAYIAPKDSIGLISRDNHIYILHKISFGETLSSIAQKYRTNVETLKAANPNMDPDKIVSESIIHVPMNSRIPENAGQIDPNLPLSKEKVIRGHTVKDGQTLFQIARLYNMDVNALKSLNRLKSDQIMANQTLLVEVEIDPAPKTEFVTHVVTSDETLSHIAQKYGVKAADIRTLNKLKSDLIFPDQKLLIERPVLSEKETNDKKNPPKKVDKMSVGAFLPALDSAKSRTINVHIIREDDHLYKIHKLYNVSMSNLKTLNNLGEKDVLMPDQKIVVSYQDTDTLAGKGQTITEVQLNNQNQSFVFDPNDKNSKNDKPDTTQNGNGKPSNNTTQTGNKLTNNTQVTAVQQIKGKAILVEELDENAINFVGSGANKIIVVKNISDAPDKEIFLTTNGFIHELHQKEGIVLRLGKKSWEKIGAKDNSPVEVQIEYNGLK